MYNAIMISNDFLVYMDRYTLYLYLMHTFKSSVSLCPSSAIHIVCEDLICVIA